MKEGGGLESDVYVSFIIPIKISLDVEERQERQQKLSEVETPDRELCIWTDFKAQRFSSSSSIHTKIETRQPHTTYEFTLLNAEWDVAKNLV